MNKNEALRLALEALSEAHYVVEHRQDVKKREQAITAIKEALAQPEQEPVGEIVDAIEGAFKCSFTKMLPVGTKLYTTPPQRTWVGLTNDEVNNFAAGCHLGNSVQGAIYKAEAKLKEKNND